MRESYRLLDLGVDGNSMRMDLQELEWGVWLDWIDLVQVRDNCWVVVNAVMNFWRP
jgi:hypothetical protein